MLDLSEKLVHFRLYSGLFLGHVGIGSKKEIIILSIYYVSF